jgi:hypothetical protein
MLLIGTWLLARRCLQACRGALLTPCGNPLPPRLHEVVDEQLTIGRRVLLVGDVHGCFEELQELLRKCGYREGEDVLILVGDLVNKGPRSAEVCWVHPGRENTALLGRSQWVCSAWQMMLLANAGGGDATATGSALASCAPAGPLAQPPTPHSSMPCPYAACRIPFTFLSQPCSLPPIYRWWSGCDAAARLFVPCAATTTTWRWRPARGTGLPAGCCQLHPYFFFI